MWQRQEGIGFGVSAAGRGDSILGSIRTFGKRLEAEMRLKQEEAILRAEEKKKGRRRSEADGRGEMK